MAKEITLAFWPPNAPTLFSIAVEAAKGIAGDPRAGGHKESLVSVVFAAAALEAFLNEVAYLAGGKSSLRTPQPAVVSAFAQLMEDAEESRAPIQSKFQLSNLVLTGSTYDKGTAPFQDFADLIAVRNLLMHGNSNERFSRVDNKPVMINPTAVLDRLTSKNVLHEAPPEHLKGFVAVAGESFLAEAVYAEELQGVSSKGGGSRIMTRWTYVVGTKAVAEWACNTASYMASDLMDKAPAGGWKQVMEVQFRNAFSAPFGTISTGDFSCSK
jgi:hypothetical protein